MLPFIWAIRVHRLGSSACHFFILPDNPAFVSIILFCFNEEFTVRNFGTNVSIKSQPLKIINTVNRNWSKITNPKTKDVGIHLKKTDLEELIENIQDSPRTGEKKAPIQHVTTSSNEIGLNSWRWYSHFFCHRFQSQLFSLSLRQRSGQTMTRFYGR